LTHDKKEATSLNYSTNTHSDLPQSALHFASMHSYVNRNLPYDSLVWGLLRLAPQKCLSCFYPMQLHMQFGHAELVPM